eukprot:gene8687-10281_t
MNMILGHSDDLVVPVLTEWLNFVDVVRLDKACSLSRTERENLSRILALPQTAFNNGRHLLNGFNVDTRGYLSWLLRRKVKLVELDITPNVIHECDLIEQIITQCGPVVRSVDFNVYNSNLMSAVTKCCSQLKKLSIDNGADIEKDCVLHSDTLETFYLAESGVMNNNISIKFPNLIDLTIVGSGISDSGFMGIVKHAPKLQRIQFDNALSLTTTSFAAVGQFCRSLDRLFVYDMQFTSDHLMVILPFTPLLKELIFCYNDGELDEQQVFEAVASYCPALTQLTLNNCINEPRSIALTAFTSMLTRCVHLFTLSLDACRFVTDDYLLAIASKATQLTKLSLSECKISKLGLAEIAQHCTELKSISFSTGRGYFSTEDDKELFRKETTVDVSTAYDMFGGGFSFAPAASGFTFNNVGGDNYGFGNIDGIDSDEE